MYKASQKSLNFSENIFNMPSILKNKKAFSQKKKIPRGNCRIATIASLPLFIDDRLYIYVKLNRPKAQLMH
jgi:hypothetical protein